MKDLYLLETWHLYHDRQILGNRPTYTLLYSPKQAALSVFQDKLLLDRYEYLETTLYKLDLSKLDQISIPTIKIEE